MRKFRISIMGIVLLFVYLVSNQYLYKVENYHLEKLLDDDVANYYTAEMKEYLKVTNQEALSLERQKEHFKKEMDKALAGETYVRRLNLWFMLKNKTSEDTKKDVSYDPSELSKINKRIKSLNKEELALYLKVVSEHQGSKK